MRLRKLGQGQSVVFMIPDEIAKKILDRQARNGASEITVDDVLDWTINETWLDLSRSMPLWAMQGFRFERHRYLSLGAKTTYEDAQALLEDEARTIAQRYKPSHRPQLEHELSMQSQHKTSHLTEIISRCHDFEVMSHNASHLEEEQEVNPQLHFSCCLLKLMFVSASLALRSRNSGRLRDLLAYRLTNTSYIQT